MSYQKISGPGVVSTSTWSITSEMEKISLGHWEMWSANFRGKMQTK